MEMEDHHHHHHHHHHNPYGLTDLRHLINGRVGPTPPATPHLNILSPTVPPPAPPPPMPSLSPPPPPAFEAMMMMGRPMISAEMIVPLGLQYGHHHAASAAATSSLSGGCGGGGGGGLEAETGGCGLGGDGGTGRWPRQETLTLLEIRSRLDSKFKEANQKGPLWDEVSRIMSEEHGYQRSGKKCREKFENLYKYYKKTKEGKAGRQDGKHYRFFRQLEALYGETSNSITTTNNNNQVISSSVQDYNNMANNLGFHNLSNANIAVPNSAHLSQLEGYNHTKHSDSLSLSNNSSEFESSSSDGHDSSGKIRRARARGSGGWKAKIKEFIDSQMRRLMEKQEAWLEKLMRTLEQKENERGLREEEWRRQESARLDREHRFWAKERAWIEARDSALMEALKGLTGKEEVLVNHKAVELGLNPNDVVEDWSEPEIARLVQVRTSLDSRYERGGLSEEALWDDVAAKMACLGHDRSAVACREKWESVGDFVKKSSGSSSKKRKENEQCGDYGNSFHNNESSSCLYSHGGYNNNNASCDQMNDGTTSSSPSNNANLGNSTSSHHHHVVNHDHGCFPFLMGEGSENLWDNYGLKINKGGQN